MGSDYTVLCFRAEANVIEIKKEKMETERETEVDVKRDTETDINIKIELMAMHIDGENRVQKINENKEKHGLMLEYFNCNMCSF